ncbi:MAG: hypothetical protein J6U75_03950 [Clostridia bacterium]|nr:hypothetical protein [Clostridia bacterium]
MNSEEVEGAKEQSKMNDSPLMIKSKEAGFFLIHSSLYAVFRFRAITRGTFLLKLPLDIFVCI